VPLETFRAVQRILNDPDRRMGPGAAPKWLGTNIYLCGTCTTDGGPKVHVNVRRGGRTPAYRCKERNHSIRNVEHTDKYVIGAVLRRLAQPDAVDLLVPAKPDVDVKALRTEAAAIRANLNELAADKALGLINRTQLIAATTKGNARLAVIEEELQNAIVESPLAPLIEAADIEKVWDDLPLSHQRLVVDHLVTVRILPVTRRGSGFDPASVDITWNDTARPER
jgi:hypothetical protein